MAAVEREGLAAEVPALAHGFRSGLAPIDRQRLGIRLMRLGSAMAPNRADTESTAWLAHMEEGLRDLPEDILFAAIDQHVKTSTFLPSVKELRDLAEDDLRDRRIAAERLEDLARLLDGSFQPAPQVEHRPEPNYCSPEEAAAICAEHGIPSLSACRGDERPRHLGPPRRPTRQDYLDMGVSPETLDQMGEAA